MHYPTTHDPATKSTRWSLRLCLTVFGLALLSAFTQPAFSAKISNLQVLHQKGQSFITFNELSGFSGQYFVYRSTSRITSTTGLTPIATLEQGSGLYKTLVEEPKGVFTINYRPFVITDLGAPLASGTGLLVYTTANNGSYYYAVTNSSDNSISVGTNSLAEPVVERYSELQGAYRYKRSNDKNWYFMWQDYKQWDPKWGYYGHVYFLDNAGGNNENKPMITWLHGKFGGQNNGEPNWIPGGRGAIWVATQDAEWNENVDPYTGRNSIPPSFWYGYGSNGKVVNWTEERLIRFMRFAIQDPQWKIDPNRVYVTGGSMGGGGGLHMAYHYPDFFAAVSSDLTWVNENGFTKAWGDWVELGFGTDFSKPGNSFPVKSPYGEYWWSGAKFEDAIDAIWLVKNSPVTLPPVGFFFRKDDPTLEMAPFPEFLRELENYKLNYKALWRNGGHVGPGDGDAAVMAEYSLLGYAVRFRRDEAYPAFSNGSASSSYDAQEGERNVRLDWSSKHKDLFTGTSDDIIDEPTTFAMTFKLTQNIASQTANVTIRNAQQFKLSSGQEVTWRNENLDGSPIASGEVTADANGLVTVPLRISWAGSRLTLTINASITCSKATGTIIGTTGSYNSIGNTRSKVFDGNTTSFFDAPSASGAWVGLDLGSAKTICKVRYYPRAGEAGRMVGGTFEGSNTADFSSGVTQLYRIETAPAYAWNEQTISNTGSFRYVRYNSPAGGWGNVAEIEMHANTAGSSNQAFQQSTAANGLVSVEAENYSSRVNRGTHAWTAKDDIASKSGAGAMQATPDNGTIITANMPTTSPELKYTVNFTKTGTHYVWIRGYATTGENNSVHVGLDGVAPGSSDNIETNSFGSWSWIKDTRDGARASINVSSTGFHTLSVYMREDGFIVDKVVLTTDANYTPTSTGPDESTKSDCSSCRVASESAKADESAGAEATTLSVSPNPATDQVTVTYYATQAGRATLNLIPVQGGRSVLTMTTPVVAGKNELKMKVGGVNTGVYMLQVRDGYQVQTVRALIAR